jgi:hypothetical protein
MTASKWITSLEKWDRYGKGVFDTDYLINEIELEVDWDLDVELDVDYIRRIAEMCDLFYYASYGNEYPKKIDGEWVIVNEDTEYSDEMREDFENWIQTV